MAPGVFRAGGEQGQGAELLGGKCPSCVRHFFPRPAYCPKCLGVVREAALGGRGVLYSYTVVRTRVPLGLPEPYAVGYVDLEGSGLRVFCLLDPDALAQLAVGMAVGLAVAPLGENERGEPCLRPYFTPVVAGARPGGSAGDDL